MIIIKIDDKWSVKHSNGRSFSGYRYGEPINFDLDNLHFAMTQEIERLRDILINAGIEDKNENL